MSASHDPSRPITESANPAALHLDDLPTRELVALMNAEDAKVAPAVGLALDSIARAVDAIADRLRGGGRLLYFGAGTSGRLGVLDAAECPPTFGIAPEQVVGVIAGGSSALTRSQEGAEDEVEPARAKVRELAVDARDCVVGISASGRTPYVIAAIETARSAGAFTIALVCNPGSALAQTAELAIEVVPGPELVAGSTRLKAGTATKLVLNLLSTCAMVRLGRVQGHRMIDLRPTNQKLLERATQLVVELSGVGADAARAQLVAQGGSVRAAVDALARNDSGSRASLGFIAGIDGGGTKTVIALGAPIGRERSTGPVRIAQPCNLASDFEGALAAIGEAIDVSFAAAGEQRTRLAALVVAAAGSGEAATRARAADRLRAAGVAERIAIVHDAAPLLVAATRDAVGIVLISGTGSFCFGRDATGLAARAGGLGALLGDDGSAYELGRAALKAAARAADGRAAKLALVRAVFDAVGSSEARAIVRFSFDHSAPARIAELAPLVLAAADEGDPIAEKLVARAASELALMAKTVARRLSFGTAPVPLVLAGGVFDHSAGLRRRVVAALQEMGVATAVLPSGEAAVGALTLARNLLAGRMVEWNWFPS